MPKDYPKMSEEFKTLVEVVARLRGPNGCPWDLEQTQKTLVQYSVEEAFELAEAIETKDQDQIRDELGDFLFQVILQAQVAEDENKFNLSQVMQNLSEKLVRRHPHVFGENKAESIQEIWQKWEETKKIENAGKKPKPIFNYPRSLPALQSAYKIGVKTRNLKFDWTTPAQVFEKVEEEVGELRAEPNSFAELSSLKGGSTQSESSALALEKLEHEIGDVLFSVAQLARHLNLEPEQCLRAANRRFESRFQAMLTASGLSAEDFGRLSDSEKEKWWAEAKLRTKKTR